MRGRAAERQSRIRLIRHRNLASRASVSSHPEKPRRALGRVARAVDSDPFDARGPAARRAVPRPAVARPTEHELLAASRALQLESLHGAGARSPILGPPRRTERRSRRRSRAHLRPAWSIEGRRAELRALTYALREIVPDTRPAPHLSDTGMWCSVIPVEAGTGETGGVNRSTRLSRRSDVTRSPLEHPRDERRGADCAPIASRRSARVALTIPSRPTSRRPGCHREPLRSQRSARLHARPRNLPPARA
jgi:hypothetical protein